MTSVQLYDTTLRDGSQKEGISFSVVDKLNIARKLDELGIHYIEGGWPGSNPKDIEFFIKAKDLGLRKSVIVAFGSTRQPNIKPEADANLKAMIDVGVKAVTLVGKSSELQVCRVLETTLEENLNMIADSIRYLRGKGITVFFDAEHFFDGFRANPDYSLSCLKVAADAGAECLVLCDTNGGSLPQDIVAAIDAVRDKVAAPLGIHAHNDSEMAVANTLAAVGVGAVQVQGTINGYGERCGNANLCSVIPNLKLKMGIDCVADAELEKLTEAAHYISEVANLVPDASLPYIGSSAFSHKGGLHVAALTKWSESYQHVDPALIGNQPRVVVSELSGRGNIIYKMQEMNLDANLGKDELKGLLSQIKLMESRGFQYENAEASFELLVHRAKPDYKAPFELVDFMVLVEKRRRPPTLKNLDEMMSEAMVKVKVGGETIHTAAEGNGPVNALDHALRKALINSYPDLASVELVDYKVRILEESIGTGSQVRVLIEFTDGNRQWRTVGSSTNIIEASWLALADSLEFWILKH